MLRVIFSFVFFLHHCICFAVDFDVIVVGTSPISMIEALYRYHSGKSVLIVDDGNVCGGAWRSIDVCGVQHVDLGCHQLWSDASMAKFLEEYVGCHIVSLDDPHLDFNPYGSVYGFYLSQGCYEMVNNLVQLINETDIVMMLNHRLDSVYIDPNNPVALARIDGVQYSTSKILITPYSGIKIENSPQYTLANQNFSKAKFYHLYLLIDDPTPFRFTYRNGVVPGVSRMMNLTYFVGLEGSGKQLLVLQYYNNASAGLAEAALESLKKNGLISTSAKILQADNHVFEQYQYNQAWTQNTKNASVIFETLSTGHIQGMAGYIPKWKQVLKPYSQAFMLTGKK